MTVSWNSKSGERGPGHQQPQASRQNHKTKRLRVKRAEQRQRERRGERAGRARREQRASQVERRGEARGAMSSRKPVRPGPGSFRLLRWVARLGVSGIEPAQLVLGISQAAAYSHISRLQRAGLLWRAQVGDGQGGGGRDHARGRSRSRARATATRSSARARSRRARRAMAARPRGWRPVSSYAAWSGSGRRSCVARRAGARSATTARATRRISGWFTPTGGAPRSRSSCSPRATSGSRSIFGRLPRTDPRRAAQRRLVRMRSPRRERAGAPPGRRGAHRRPGADRAARQAHRRHRQRADARVASARTQPHHRYADRWTETSTRALATEAGRVAVAPGSSRHDSALRRARGRTSEPSRAAAGGARCAGVSRGRLVGLSE